MRDSISVILYRQPERRDRLAADGPFRAARTGQTVVRAANHEARAVPRQVHAALSRQGKDNPAFAFKTGL